MQTEREKATQEQAKTRKRWQHKGASVEGWNTQQQMRLGLCKSKDQGGPSR